VSAQSAFPTIQQAQEAVENSREMHEGYMHNHTEFFKENQVERSESFEENQTERVNFFEENQEERSAFLKENTDIANPLERKEFMQEENTERREFFSEQPNERQDFFTLQRDERRNFMEERTDEVREKVRGHIARRFDQATENLKQIVIRIENKVKMLNDYGVDTSAIENALDGVMSDIDQAEQETAKLNELQAQESENFDDVRAQAKVTKDAVISVYNTLREIVAMLRSLAGEEELESESSDLVGKSEDEDSAVETDNIEISQ